MIIRFSPINLLIFLIIISWLVGIKIFLVSANPWIAFIFIILFIGGVLILYVFVISLLEENSTKLKNFNLYLISFIRLILIFFLENLISNWSFLKSVYVLNWSSLLCAIFLIILILRFISVLIKNPNKTLKSII